MALTKITGQVVSNTTDVTVGVLTVSGISTFTGRVAIGTDLRVEGSVSVGGTITYEDVTNIDAVGLVTARNGIVVGSGITLSKDGDIFATGIITATSFVGSGANLTGVASTENIRTNTNATFLQNVTVVGTSTVTGNIVPSSDSATDIGTNSVRFQNIYGDTLYGDGSNLTGIAATDNVRTGILDVAGVSTFRNTMNVGAAVTISESGIEASGIGITVANINGNQLGGRRNIMINGNMVCHQRGGTITFSNSAYSLDRWLMRTDGHSGAANITQSSTSPDGFQSSLKVDVTTADTSLTGGEYFFIDQRIEANNIHHAAYGNSGAKTMTLSFYVRSNKTGTYNVHLYNPSSTRQLSRSYTINSADTWERKILTIPGDTSGGLTTGTGAGMRCNWYLAAGTSYTSGSNQATWSAYSVGNTAPSNVNLLDSTSNEWYLTGVQLEIGSEATPYEHRSLGEELALCQRYFYKIIGTSDDIAAIGFAQSSSDNYFNMEFPVPMRDYPTLTGSATPARFLSANNGQDFNLNSMSLSSNMTNANPKRVMLYVNQGGTSGGYGGALHFQNQEGFLEFSAEI